MSTNRRCHAVHNDEEIAEMRSSIVGLEMELMRQREMQWQHTSAGRTAVHASWSMDRYDAMPMLPFFTKGRVKALCGEKDGRLGALRDELEQMRRDRQQLIKVNSRLQVQAAAMVTTPQAGSIAIVRDAGWPRATGNPPQTSDETEATAQPCSQEMEELKNELGQATADVDRLRDDRYVHKL